MLLLLHLPSSSSCSSACPPEKEKSAENDSAQPGVKDIRQLTHDGIPRQGDLFQCISMSRTLAQLARTHFLTSFLQSSRRPDFSGIYIRKIHRPKSPQAGRFVRQTVPRGGPHRSHIEFGGTARGRGGKIEFFEGVFFLSWLLRMFAVAGS